MRSNNQQGHVVLEKKIGNTTCMICDDYCKDTSPEDVQEILDRIAVIWARSLVHKENNRVAIGQVLKA